MAIIYMEEITVASTMIKVLYVFGIFTITSGLSMTLLYISQLHNTMKTVNIENVKLLDGMHEGLLILLKSDPQRPMFCNKTA